MAWEIRVSAAPDFHLTIFVEFQTNHMSADGLNHMSGQAPKKIQKIRTVQNPCSSPKRFGGEFEGNLSSEKVPLKNLH